VKASDRLRSAASFKDKPARLTEREADFCKLLIDLALQARSPRIPAVFDSTAGRLIFDQGCMKMAEHRGFVRPLTDDADGVVSSVELTFDV
jgi:hypothetical protein